MLSLRVYKDALPMDIMSEKILLLTSVRAWSIFAEVVNPSKETVVPPHMGSHLTFSVHEDLLFVVG